MTRRKREIIGLTNERDFPHLVELALPPGGFRCVFLEIDAFHRERRIPGASWPLAARAQQVDRVTRIGVLMTQAADDLEGQSRLLALAQGLQESGWTIGRNVQIDTRWGAGDAERYRRYAAELVALAPDVILANGARICPQTICRSSSPMRNRTRRRCNTARPEWAPQFISPVRGSSSDRG